jgi:hypothetical protein
MGRIAGCSLAMASSVDCRVFVSNGLICGVFLATLMWSGSLVNAGAAIELVPLCWSFLLLLKVKIW